jgi:hypothetical protein
MARRDSVPVNDATLLEFVDNLYTVLNIDPVAFGITKTVVDELQTRMKDYAGKLKAAVDPSTRGQRTVFLKNESKASLLELTRKMCQQIGRTMSVTDAQRQELGLPILDKPRHNVPVPTTSPVLEVTKTSGRTVTLELKAGKSKRGKPAKVAGASIFSYTGEQAPETAEGWVFLTNTTRTTVEIPFGPSDQGDTVWITAFWYNSKAQSGPANPGISVELPASKALPKNVVEKMKKAA